MNLNEYKKVIDYILGTLPALGLCSETDLISSVHFTVQRPRAGICLDVQYMYIQVSILCM